MKIAFDAKRAFLNRSGLGNYSRSIINLLSRYYPEEEYFLFTPSADGTLFQPNDRQKVIQPEGFLPTQFSSWWRSFGLTKEVANLKADIYHGLSNELPFNFKKTGIHSIVTIHDLIFERFPELYPIHDRRMYRLKFRSACETADLIIAVSEATKADLIDFYKVDPKKIQVAYQTCNPSFLIKISDDDRKQVLAKNELPEAFVLSVGTIEPRKNMLNILKALHKANLDIPLVLVGRPTPFQQKIVEYAESNSIRRKLIILNDVPSEDLPALYQSCKVFAYPSRFEGFGIPILEALSSGVPVVTSTGSCFSETAGDAALFANPDSIDELSDRLTLLLSDSDMRNELISRGNTQASKFTGDKIAKRIMELYHQYL